MGRRLFSYHDSWPLSNIFTGDIFTGAFHTMPALQDTETLVMTMHERFNIDIWRVWEKHFGDAPGVPAPLLYPNSKGNCILFIGLNPSFPEFVKLPAPLEGARYQEYMEWRGGNADQARILQIESETTSLYPYFRKFQEIEREVGVSQFHVDLFCYRETSQKTIISKMFRDFESHNLENFGRQQLDLAVNFIRDLKPKVIVVCNATASRIFCKEFQINLLSDFDAEAGYHSKRVSNSISIPVFFSSMLTGQRALDTFSYQRLKWHIKRALEKHHRA